MKNLPVTLKLSESVYCVEPDGVRPETVRRLWKERLFTLPWRPWIATKVIEVPNFKPAIYRIGNLVLYHPSLREAVMKAMRRE